MSLVSFMMVLRYKVYFPGFVKPSVNKRAQKKKKKISLEPMMSGKLQREREKRTDFLEPILPSFCMLGNKFDHEFLCFMN